ncbi:MAG: hypothetical protein ABRQ37_28190 [Candidatus Eremiobacterota bacterium]
MYTKFLSVLIMLLFTSTLSFAGEYWIKVQNKEGGEITVSKDKGNSWNNIGNVLIPVNELTEPNQPGFTAADYGSDSSIVASAVNAIHIRISKPGRFSRIFSLLPVECKDLDKDYKSYHGSAIITDIEGEESIFGKDYSPYIGNRVYLANNDNMELLSPDYVPHTGDELVIKVIPPSTEKPVKYIWIDNKINGYVMVVYEDLSVSFAARVLKPVAGVGGFTGSSLVGSNHIRANHPGVLEISTSKRFRDLGADLVPKEGGQTAFQIVPFEHTLEYPCKENKFEGFFGYARITPVYLILMPPSSVFVEKKRFLSKDKDGIIKEREAMEQAWGENPDISTDPGKVLSDYCEIKDKDYSSVFGTVVNSKPEERLYGHGFFFGGCFKAGTCETSVKRTGKNDFYTLIEYNEGKNLTVLEDVQDIKIYYTGY